MKLVRCLLTLAAGSSLLVAPVVTPASATARPVTPEVTSVAVRLELAAPSGGKRDGQPVPSPTATREQSVGAAASTSSGGTATLVTPVIPADGFASVGATWSGAASDAVVIEVRVARAGEWGRWTQLPPGDTGPDADTEEARRAPEAGTESLWVGDADNAQLRVTGRDDQMPETMELSLIDPGTSPADGLPRTPLASADAATARPVIISRAQWGADESLKNCSTSASSTIKAAVLHHTAGPNTYSSPAEAMRQLRSDYAYHTTVRGWCDFGYNFVVDKWGNVYEGRSGGIDRPVVGAHAGGFNRDTVGVAMLGTYSTVAPSVAQRRAVAEVIGWKLSLYGRNPHGYVDLTSAGGGTSRYPAGQTVRLPVVMGHRDVGYTECPGNAGQSILPAVRDQAAGRIQVAAFGRALYADMMGRPADDGGLRTWTSHMVVGGKDRRFVVRGFASSDEYRLLNIDRGYRQVLGRDPEPEGRRWWLQELRSGRVRIEMLQPSLMQSQEFYLRAGGTDGGWVDMLYRSALGRSAATEERRYWTDVKRQQGALAVINGIWGSPEAGMRRVNAAYGYYLGRSASRSEQEYWLPVVKGFGDENLREELTISQEYFLRAARRFP